MYILWPKILKNDSNKKSFEILKRQKHILPILDRYQKKMIVFLNKNKAYIKPFFKLSKKKLNLTTFLVFDVILRIFTYKLISYYY